MLLSDAKELVKRAYAANHLSHAFIIEGSPRGVGGDMAVYMTQMVTCKEADAPCGQCNVCRQIASRIWCDSLWVYPLKKSRVISADQMRRGSGENKVTPPYLIPWLDETSYAGGWKVAVVSEAERMNDSAANAFLKTLEEPPPQTLILLVTASSQMLLPTIRSRCQQIDIDEPLSELAEPWRGEVISILRNISYSGPLASTAVSGKLIAVLKDMLSETEKSIAAEAKEDSGVDVDDDEIAARLSSANRANRELLVRMLQYWYRDILILKAGGDPSTIYNVDSVDILRERASKLTLAQAMANIEAIDGILRQLNQNLTEAVVFPYWLDRVSAGV